MRTDQIPFATLAPGVPLSLTVHRFGAAGSRPQVYIQAALHADEIPAMMAAHHLRERLQALDAEGRIRGEIILVPSANPIGLAQRVMGQHIGRFDLSDGVNFNRGYPFLATQVEERVSGRLGPDAAANVAMIREALRAELDRSPAKSPTDVLKKTLLGLAIEADLVLDMHCDSEAAVHLYTLTPSAETFAPLGALLGAVAVLLATESGDDPFDEACSRPWNELRDRLPDHPIPLACEATTLEFRGQADVSHAFGRHDAEAVLAFLNLRGAIDGPPPEIPASRCEPTPLAASEPLESPVAGIIAYHAACGASVKAGDVIADIIDPTTGEVTPVMTTTDGVLYARSLSRFTAAGRRIGKVAGTEANRTGKLLSP